MKEKFSGNKIVVAAFMYLFVAMGALGCLSVFMPSICAENGFTVPQVSVMFTCAGLTGAVSGMFITPLALKKLGARGCIFVAAVILVGHLLWYSFATTLTELYIAACLGGLAIGVGTMAACGALIGNWFVEKRAQMTGIVMAGAGVGGAVIQALAGALIDSIGYRSTYRVIVAIVAVVSVIALLIIHNRPEDIGEKPYGFSSGAQTADVPELPGLTAKEAMKTASFWLAFFGIALGTLAYMCIMSYIVTLLTSPGYDMSTSTASIFTAILALSGAIAMMFNGKFVEKLGFVKYIIMTGLAAVIGALIFGLSGASITGMLWLIFIAVVCASLGSSRQTADAQTTTAFCFGMKDFGSIQAYFAAAANLGNIFMAVIVSALLGAGKTLAFCYIVFAVIAAASMILLVLAKKTSPLK